MWKEIVYIWDAIVLNWPDRKRKKYTINLRVCVSNSTHYAIRFNWFEASKSNDRSNDRSEKIYGVYPWIPAYKLRILCVCFDVLLFFCLNYQEIATRDGGALDWTQFREKSKCTHLLSTGSWTEEEEEVERKKSEQNPRILQASMYGATRDRIQCRRSNIYV